MSSLHDPAVLEDLAQRCREIEQQVMARVGSDDAHYIYRVRRIVRVLEWSGRLLIYCFIFPPLWALGVLLLAVAKIIQNTELGHNIMHGQYDWIGDPAFSGEDYEMDAVMTGEGWRSSHNGSHHGHTGVEGLDNDITFLRLSPEQPWKPLHLLQPGLALGSALFAQWGVAVQNLRIGDYLAGRQTKAELIQSARQLGRKTRWQVLKDYVLFPALAGPFFLYVMLGNLLANGLRNVWAWLVIASGHCVSGVKIFAQEEVGKLPEQHGIVRQIEGSANFSCGRIMRVLTGHLGYHIEHHLFPRVPSYRYPELAREVQLLCQDFGLSYNTRSFGARVREVIGSIMLYALPVGRRTDNSMQIPPTSR